VSPLALAGSLAAKELAAVLPPALVLLHLSDRTRPPSWRGALRDTAGHWLVLALAAAAFAAGPYPRLLRESLALRGPVENLLTHAQAVGWLAGQLVLVGRLNADPALPAVAVPGAGLLLWAAALLALAVGGLVALRRHAAAPAALWFLLWLAPTGWWLPRAEPANDRQLYLALLAPAWLLGRALAAWASRGTVRAAAAAALLAALAGATAHRNLVYRDEVRFWEDVAAKAPHNVRAFNNLGFALAHAGRGAEAEAAFRRALALDPGDYRARTNLARLRAGDLVPRAGAP
jgi:tetratricopeptide (TPR) repeat protein